MKLGRTLTTPEDHRRRSLAEADRQISKLEQQLREAKIHRAALLHNACVRSRQAA
jgi:hypothetical protein